MEHSFNNGQTIHGFLLRVKLKTSLSCPRLVISKSIIVNHYDTNQSELRKRAQKKNSLKGKYDQSAKILVNQSLVNVTLKNICRKLL